MSVAPQIAAAAHCMVSSGHRSATASALRILQDGGNAVDAAVAGAAVLSVVLPYACGLGGDVYMLIYEKNTGKIHGLNGTGRAPTAATPESFDGAIPREGIHAATVPGMVQGWQDALDRFGGRDLADLLQPAIQLAADGFPAHRAFIENTQNRESLLQKSPEATATFLAGGKPPAPDDPVRQPALAELLSSIAKGGARDFYEGGIAARLVAGFQALDGLLSREDMAAHRSLWQEPISAPFYGTDVVTMPPNSWGIALLLQLIELEALKIGERDPAGAEFVADGIAARRAAYRAAASLVADPERVEADARELVQNWIAGQADANNSTDPVPLEGRGSDTSNLVVVDQAGNAVSLIQSVSTPYGSGVVIDGMLLNNRLQGFNLDPTSANCVGPAKRPAHTLAPVLVMRDGELSMTLGTPGAPGQTCTMAQFLARVLACGESLEAAAAAPRWSVDFAGKPIIEDIVDGGRLAALEALEPDITVRPTGWITFGSVKAISRSETGLNGIADGRRVAAVCGA